MKIKKGKKLRVTQMCGLFESVYSTGKKKYGLTNAVFNVCFSFGRKKKEKRIRLTTKSNLTEEDELFNATKFMERYNQICSLCLDSDNLPVLIIDLPYFDKAAIEHFIKLFINTFNPDTKNGHPLVFKRVKWEDGSSLLFNEVTPLPPSCYESITTIPAYK